MIGIYKLTNKYNRKTYIGKSTNIEKRYKAHQMRAKHNHQSYFYTAVRKWGIEGFDFEVIHECPTNQLDYWEKFYIRYYCSNVHDYGYNMTEGGTGGKTSEHPWNYGMKGLIPWNKNKTGCGCWNKGIKTGKGGPKGMHKVYDDETNTKYHMEKNTMIK